jgi:hypothetical protein
MAAHSDSFPVVCSRTSLTARSLISCGNCVPFPMTSSSQRIRSPVNPGRFRGVDSNGMVTCTRRSSLPVRGRKGAERGPTAGRTATPEAPDPVATRMNPFFDSRRPGATGARPEFPYFMDTGSRRTRKKAAPDEERPMVLDDTRKVNGFPRIGISPDRISGGCRCRTGPRTAGPGLSRRTATRP